MLDSEIILDDSIPFLHGERSINSDGKAGVLFQFAGGAYYINPTLKAWDRALRIMGDNDYTTAMAYLLEEAGQQRLHISMAFDVYNTELLAGKIRNIKIERHSNNHYSIRALLCRRPENIDDVSTWEPSRKAPSMQFIVYHVLPEVGEYCRFGATPYGNNVAEYAHQSLIPLTFK